MAAEELFRLEPASVRCPYPLFERLRSEAPVAYVDAIEAFAVTRYDDVVHVAKHPELFSSRAVTGPVFARQMADTMAALAAEHADAGALLGELAGHGQTAVLLNADPPLHSRQRKLVSRAFTPRRVKQHEATIAAVAADLVGEFGGRGAVDLVAAFAVPLPLRIIARLLGVPERDMASFKQWSDSFVVAIGNHDLSPTELAQMLRSQSEFSAYFLGHIEDRRRRPRDDLLTDIVTAQLDGDELSNAELLSLLTQLLVAGNETTTKLIASSVLHLSLHPEMAARLREDTDGIPPFVEEILRLHAPVQGLFRTANEDCEVGGVPIPADAHLWLAYGSANRDETVFAEAARCLIGRRATAPHVAFGLGEHFCVGAALARAEARIGLTELLSRLDEIRLAIPEDELEYEPSYALHGLKRLPLTFRPNLE